MASGSGRKVRFVKCPKCLRVLLEDEDVPVYQCGACSTILQAKKRSICVDVPPKSAETEGIHLSESQRVSEVERSSSSSPEMVVSSSGEFSACLEGENGQNGGSVDSIGEQLAGFKLSNGEQTDNNIQSRRISAGDPKQNGAEVSRFEADEGTEEVVGELGSNSGSSSVDNVAAASETTSSVDCSPRQGAESLPSNILLASPDAEEHDQGNNNRGHSHGESTDDLQSRDVLANRNSSPYDGSVSSSDGSQDQHPDSAGVSPEKRLRNGKFVMQDQPEKKEQGTSSSAMSPEEKHYGTRVKKWDQFRSLQLGGAGERPHRNWHRQGTQQSESYLPLYGKGPSFSSAYEHRSPSYYAHDDFDGRSRAYSLQLPPYGGHGHFGPGLHWKENHTPGYTNHEGLDNMYHDISNGIHTRARDWGQTSRASRIPFSGESVMNRRHHIGDPYWRSGQFHSSYGSYHGSPQQHMEPEYYPGWSHEIVSDVEDQHRRGEPEVQTYLRERQSVAAKRHVRPTAGGAPFTSCYHCSQTLQMPADFLIFKRKHHFLRCGACMNVLRFSFQDGTRLVPNLTDPPPESESLRDINARGSVNSASGYSRNEVPKPEKRSSSPKNEELPVARGSPLHRLLGYSTVSQVFKVSRRPSSPKISHYDQTLKN